MASKFQSKVIAEHRAAGWTVVKIISASTNGWPDSFMFRSGEFKAIEFKEGGDTLKDLQKFRIDELIKQGFTALCIHETKGQIYP